VGFQDLKGAGRKNGVQ